MGQIFVGIDVAKAAVEVCVRPTGEAFAVPRDEVGLARLVERLRAWGPALVVLEATGGYEASVAAALAEGGLAVVVVNPRDAREDRPGRRPAAGPLCRRRSAPGPAAADRGGRRAGRAGRAAAAARRHDPGGEDAGPTGAQPRGAAPDHGASAVAGARAGRH